MDKFFNWLVYTKWKVIRTCWPYPSGYGTYCKNRWTGKRIILNVGLKKQEAQEIVDELNESI